MKKSYFYAVLSLLLSLILLIGSAAPLSAGEHITIYSNTGEETPTEMTNTGKEDSSADNKEDSSANKRKNLRLFSNETGSSESVPADDSASAEASRLTEGIADYNPAFSDNDGWDNSMVSSESEGENNSPADNLPDDEEGIDDFTLSDEGMENASEGSEVPESHNIDSDESKKPALTESETESRLAEDESSTPSDDSSLAADSVAIEVIEETPSEEKTVGASVSSYFNVTSKEFGANGNDSAGDSSQINKALYEAKKSAESLKKMVEVYVPAGTYYLDNVLLIYSNTWLHLHPSAVFIRMDMTREMISGTHRDQNNNICYHEGCKHGGYSQVGNVKISGGRWNGNIRSNNCSGPKISRDLLTFRHCSDLVIADTVIGDDCSMHSVSIDGVKNLTVTNVTFQNHYRYTGTNGEYYGWVNANPSTYKDYWVNEALHIDEIYPENSHKSYPLEKLSNQNVKVENCTFRNVVSGLGTHNFHEDNPSINISVLRNTFDKVFYYCINAYCYKDLEVLYNKATNVTGFLKGTRCTGVKREYCYIQKNTVECSSLPGLPAQDTIFIDGKSNVFIEDNTFRNIQSRCIVLEEAVSSKTDTAYNKAVINRNLLENATGLAKERRHYDAILIGKGCSANMWKNTIYLQEHSISGYETKGVMFEYAAKGSKMSKNIIRGGNVGIYIRETNGVSLTSNEVKWTKSFGAYCVRCNSLELTGNLFMSNDKNGFMFDWCNGAKTWKNSALWNGDKDLWIENSKNIEGLNSFNANKFKSSDGSQKCLKYVEGDINYDGSLTLLDVQVLRKFVARPEDALRSETYMGDIARDGTLTNADISGMLGKIVQ